MTMVKTASPLVVNCLLALAFGLGFVFSYFRLPSQAQVLGQAVSQQSSLQVMRVSQLPSKSAPIILPVSGVYSDDNNGKPYVLVVDDQQLVKREVQLTPWRGEYAQILDGLLDQDLVVLDKRAKLNQPLGNYHLINPEAGNSGLIGN